MKKLPSLLVFFILPVLIIVLLILYVRLPGKQYKGWRQISYRLENRNYRLLVAKNQSQWEQGLMYFRKLDGVGGMIFEFPDKQYRTFWNKNTYMNLKLYWLDGDKVVGTSDLPSIEKSGSIITVSSPAPVNNVIEMKQ